MNSEQLEQISDEIQALHKPMKNLIEVVFAISPLLALSTHGWTWNSINGIYLLRVSFVLIGFLEVINYCQDICCSR